VSDVCSIQRLRLTAGKGLALVVLHFLRAEVWTGTSSGLHRDLTETSAYDALTPKPEFLDNGQRIIGKPRRRCQGVGLGVPGNC